MLQNAFRMLLIYIGFDPSSPLLKYTFETEPSASVCSKIWEIDSVRLSSTSSLHARDISELKYLNEAARRCASFVREIMASVSASVFTPDKMNRFSNCLIVSSTVVTRSSSSLPSSSASSSSSSSSSITISFRFRRS